MTFSVHLVPLLLSILMSCDSKLLPNPSLIPQDFICPLLDGFYENTNNNQSYVYCFDGTAYLQFCQYGEVFEPSYQSCVWRDAPIPGDEDQDEDDDSNKPGPPAPTFPPPISSLCQRICSLKSSYKVKLFLFFNPQCSCPSRGKMYNLIPNLYVRFKSSRLKVRNKIKSLFNPLK